MKRKNGFTLMEIMIVVVLVAIVSTFAIAEYSKSMARNEQKQKLLTVQAAESFAKIQLSRGASPCGFYLKESDPTYNFYNGQSTTARVELIEKVGNTDLARGLECFEIEAAGGEHYSKMGWRTNPPRGASYRVPMEVWIGPSTGQIYCSQAPCFVGTVKSDWVPSELD